MDPRGLNCNEIAPDHQNVSSVSSWSWTIISTFLGLALSFAFQNPVMCALLPYLVTVFKPFATALWLFHHDDHRKRAWICFSAYIAFGYLLGSVMAVASLAIYVQVMNALGQPIRKDLLNATALAATLGLCATSTIGAIGIFGAWYCRIRVWISPDLRRESGDEFENLSSQRQYRQGNYAIYVVPLSMFFPVLSAIAWGVAIATKPPHGFINNIVTPIILLLFVPAVLITFYACLSNRIIARHPSECWTDADVSADRFSRPFHTNVSSSNNRYMPRLLAIASSAF